MISFMFLWALIAFGFALSAPLPLGMPPLPEDPALLRVAPKDTLAFVEWFGTAKPNPQTRNVTEKLASEDEVQHLVRRVVDELTAMIERNAGNEAATALTAFELAKTLAMRPGCVFFAKFDPRSAQFEAGVVVHLGDRKDAVAKLANRLEAQLVDRLGRFVDSPEPQILAVDGVEFRVLPTPSGPQVAWTIHGDHIALAIGKKTPGSIVAGLQGDPGLGGSPRFAAAHGEVAVARPSYRSYVDLGQILDMAAPFIGAEGQSVISALGFADAGAVASESGLEGGGFVQRTLIATPKPKGLIRLLDGRPLTPADLRIVPADATGVAALRVSPQRSYRLMLDLIGKIDPDSLAEFGREVLVPFERTLGVELDKDLIGHLGDTVVVWNAPSTGGFAFSGLTIAIELGDADAFHESYATAMKRLGAIAPPKEYSAAGRLRRGVYLEHIEFRGRTIHFVNTIDDEVPFTPSWCATDTHLLVSLLPQAIKATIARTGASLADDPGIAGLEPSVAFCRFDAAELFAKLYPVALPFAQMAFGEMQREGFGLTVADLPSPVAIQPHLRPETTTLQLTDTGVVTTHSGTIPWMDPVLGIGMPMLGVMPLIAIQRMQVAPVRIR